jgi:oxygen-independent coproporphyrinogen-3 oxidase
LIEKNESIHSYYNNRIIKAFNTDYKITDESSAELYDRLSQLTGKTLPWGIYTGVHPIRYIRENRGKLTDFRISPEKLALADEIIAVQPCGRGNPDPTHIYIGIPFCASRCKYCSFVSETVGKSHKLIPQYIDLLLQELQTFPSGKKFDAVYIGGGTPTAIALEQLQRLLDVIPKAPEYTLEAGRPETLTEEVIQAAKQAGVTRISINPQSMNDDVLQTIGRGHTAADIYKAYERARGQFEVINMDLIMLSDFMDSLNKVIELSPENITVHSLAKKRAANFTIDTPDYTHAACEILKKAGYFPYYLYRQSDSTGDNIGYTRKPEHMSLYNIYMMDESSTVCGAGCGAASRVFRNGRAIKHYNFKYPYEYINRFNEILNKRGIFQ